MTTSWRYMLTVATAGIMAVCSQSGCADDGPVNAVDDLATGAAYVESAEFRRNTLEDSMVADNPYAALRLENYGLSGSCDEPPCELEAWELLPVWNPPTRAVTDDDLGLFEADPYALSPAGSTFEALPVTFEWSHEGLMAAGEHAFHRYPVQLDARLISALDDVETTQRMGLWHGMTPDGVQAIGGLVRVELQTELEGTATTCSTCHASDRVSDVLALGVANSTLNYDVLIVAGAQVQWGSGQLDVTSDGVDNPVAIPDLRPIRHQARLHATGSVHNGLAELAVRIETLLITSSSRRYRPPREIVFALAYYLWNLSPADPAIPEAPAVFTSNCSGCHGDAIRPAREWVALSEVGTEALVSQGERATGGYRVPSLAGVSTRGQLLHDSSFSDLESMFSQDRDPGIGHAFGLDLTTEEHEALLQFLNAL